MSQRSLLINIIWNTLQSLARQIDQRRTDVYTGDVVAEAGKVFTEPSRAAANIEDARPCRQRQRDGHVGKVTEVAMGIRVGTITFIFFGMLVGEIVERFGQQMISIAGCQPFRILDRAPLVVYALNLTKALIGFLDVFAGID